VVAYPPGNTAERAWARAQLTRGRSTGEVWEISSAYPEARLSLGADPSAGWPISAPGVHGSHCELFWDGQALWVADTQGVGGVFLDGQRVSEWVQIHGPAELRFGQAALDIETSAPLQAKMVSSPDHARPVTRTDMVAPPDLRSGQAIFGGAAGDDSLPDLDAAATRVVSAPPSFGAPGAAARPSAPPAQPEAPSLDLRPRLGGGVASSAGPVAAEATRMVAMPMPPPAKPLAPPRPPAPPAQSAPPPPPPPAAGPPAPPVAAEPPPQPPPQPPTWSDPGPAFVGPPADAGAGGKKGAGLAGVLQKLKPESSADVVAAAGGTKGQSLPTRTWIMLGVTMAAAVGLLMWEEEPVEEAEAPAAVQPGTPTVAVAAQPGTDPAPAATPGTPVAPVEPEPGGSAPSEPGAPTEVATPSERTAPSPPTEGGSQPASEPDEAPTGPSMQRQAIDHYVAGRYPEALEAYRALQAQSPDEPSYVNMVRILERRVRCGPGGTPCANP
jgi:hypothetical protein